MAKGLDTPWWHPFGCPAFWHMHTLVTYRQVWDAGLLSGIATSMALPLVLYSGKMFSPHEAKDLGLVDLVYDSDDLVEKNILSYAKKDLEAIKDLKKSLNIYDQSALLDTDEKLELFLDIFYSDTTQEILKKIKINK